MRLVDVHDALKNRRTFGFFDDFEWLISPHRWTSVISDLGAVTNPDATGGRILLTPSDGTVADNDEIYLRTTAEIFLFANDKPLVAECRLQYAEAATNAANIIFGLMDAVAADAILDNGAGPKASYSGAVIYKVDGETVWRTQTSIAAAKTTNQSASTAGGSAFQTLALEFKPITSTLADVTFYLDGSQLRTSAGVPIKHAFTYTSATEMQLMIGIKNGSGTLETLTVDYAACFQLR